MRQLKENKNEKETCFGFFEKMIMKLKMKNKKTKTLKIIDKVQCFFVQFKYEK